jgi:hypothetical protein
MAELAEITNAGEAINSTLTEFVGNYEQLLLFKVPPTMLYDSCIYEDPISDKMLEDIKDVIEKINSEFENVRAYIVPSTIEIMRL